MELPDFWFGVITLFWLGYVFLEGFDFGVGMLLPVLGRTDVDRRVMVNTIGPVWDGNEVWLIVAAGATFAAFPDWYADLFSGAYLPLLLVLLALIGRGVAFEYRGKGDTARWRRAWDKVIILGSWLPALGIGAVLATTFIGLPLSAQGNRVGAWWSILRPETALGALGLAGFALLHGATFITLKTEGDIRLRARRIALRLAPFAPLPLLALALDAQLREGHTWTWITLAIAVLAAILAPQRLRAGRDGQAFTALGGYIATTMLTLFGALYPRVLPSTIDSAFSLTVHNAASGSYTLTVMTWLAAFGAPAVLAYQGWTYWVFRKRIGSRHIPAGH